MIPDPFGGISQSLWPNTETQMGSTNWDSWDARSSNVMTWPRDWSSATMSRATSPLISASDTFPLPHRSTASHQPAIIPGTWIANTESSLSRSVALIWSGWFSLSQSRLNAAADLPAALIPNTLLAVLSNRWDGKSQNSSCSDRTVLLTVVPGVDNGVSGGGADWVRALGGDTSKVDRRGLGSRQFLGQSIVEGVVVDGSGNGVTDGATNGREQRHQRKHHRNTFLVGSSHNGHLLANNKHSSGKGNEDLTHDDVTDVRGVLTTEVDQQTTSQDLQWKSKEQTSVLEVLGDTHVKTKDWRPETRTNIENLQHVTGVSDTQVVNDKNEVVVVQIPAVETDVVDGSQNTSSNDGRISEQLVFDEVNLGSPFLPSSKDWEQAATNDDHGNELSGVVSGSSVSLQREWKQEQNEGSHEDESTNDIKLVEVVLDGLPVSSARVAWFDHTELDSLDVVVFEHTSKRKKDKRHHNGENTETPSPSSCFQDGFCSERTSESGTDEWGTGESESESPVSKTAGISDENVEDEVDGIQVDTNEDNESLGTSPDVEHFTNWKLQNTTNDSCQNVSSTNGRGSNETGISVRHHGSSDGLLQSKHEVTHPNPGVGGVDSPFRPDHQSTFNGLDTLWSVGANLANGIVKSSLLAFWVGDDHLLLLRSNNGRRNVV
ncbi:hypothetical protein OGAPHI_006325 [Ogataea philodendri]|uniref:Uncharacterized protein n=1 Tax=Ogataea philodendri TaxID=1378263 RepID=A0A9P8NWB0_9ASCO|nr:uncharacterized protein OGAPHI_006325 [Ogataea philodendri]KAH3661478.1 hypothetical protein OGAPHI_006325 [Ogataea philodendri]